MSFLKFLPFLAGGIVLFYALVKIYNIVMGLESKYSTGSKTLNALDEQKHRTKQKGKFWNKPPMVNILSFVGNYIVMTNEEEFLLTEQLARVGMLLTARQYSAKKIVCLFGCFAVTFALYLCGLMIAVPLGIALAVCIYIKVSQELTKIIKKKNDKVVQSLPPFILSVIASVKNGSDVISIVERYIPFASSVLKPDLERLLVEMKTESINDALVGFERRMSIKEVTRIVNILINVNRGVNQDEALELLSGDMLQLMQDNLTKEYSVRPDKLRAAGYPAAGITIINMLYMLLASLMGFNL